MIPEKSVLRKTMRDHRSALSCEEASARSLAAQHRVLASVEWLAASSVGLYIAVRQEVETSLLVEEAWRMGKKVYLPRISPSMPGRMHFFRYFSGQILEKNRFGIPEPGPDASLLPPADNGVPEVIIVPGVAFDRKGHRLGNGGGYYDRLFSEKDMRRTIRIGFAYSFQLVADVPVEDWDTPMHAIATEEELIWL